MVIAAKSTKQGAPRNQFDGQIVSTWNIAAEGKEKTTASSRLNGLIKTVNFASYAVLFHVEHWILELTNGVSRLKKNRRL
ncbi:MAG: hypothetical protein IT443_04880 [Phycisphaeraceae bacterium]|nr:hypothetical protein [Phycisphaeraceae bacterium]